MSNFIHVVIGADSSCMQDNWPSVMFAMAGGVALSLGNLSSQYAWAFVGLSVTEVLICSIIVVIGLHHLCSHSIYLHMSLKYMCLKSHGIPPLCIA